MKDYVRTIFVGKTGSRVINIGPIISRTLVAVPKHRRHSLIAGDGLKKKNVFVAYNLIVWIHLVVLVDNVSTISFHGSRNYLCRILILWNEKGMRRNRLCSSFASAHRL